MKNLSLHSLILSFVCVSLSIQSSNALEIVYFGGTVVDIEVGYSAKVYKYNLFRDGALLQSNMISSEEVIYYSDSIEPNSQHTYQTEIFKWDYRKEIWVNEGMSEPMEVDTSFYGGTLYNKVGNRFKRSPVKWNGEIRTKNFFNLVNGLLEIERGSSVEIDGNFSIYADAQDWYEESDASFLVRDVTFTVSENPNSSPDIFIYGYDGTQRNNSPIERCYFYGVSIWTNYCKSMYIKNNFLSGRGAGIYTSWHDRNIFIQNNISLEGDTYISISGEECEIINNKIYGLDIDGRDHFAQGNEVDDRLLIQGQFNVVERCRMKELDIHGSDNYAEFCTIEDHQHSSHPEVGAVSITWGGNNIVQYCTIRNNGVKGVLISRGAENNTIAHNVIENNRGGVEIYGQYPNMVCRENKIFDNKIRNNSMFNVLDDGEDNQWSEDSLYDIRNIVGGRFTGGNYYGDYEGLDVNDDGIGDTPFTIPGTAGSVDPYPLHGLMGYQLETVILPEQGGSVSVSPRPQDGVYEEDQQVTLTATPSEGYFFEQWSGGVFSQNNPVTITMDRDKRVFAIFTPEAESGNGAHGELEDPVNTATGEFYFDMPLIDLGGPHPLTFSLYYGSNVYKKETLKQTFGPTMGYIFLHNYNMLFQPIPNQPRVKVFYKNGRSITFQWDPVKIGWKPRNKEDIPFTLFRVVDGWLFMDPSVGKIFKFRLDGLLRYIEDRNGNRISLIYDNNKVLTSINDGLGREINFEYEHSKLTKITDGYGRAFTFTYSDTGLLTSIVDPMERITRFEYDLESTSPGLITRVIQPNGNSHMEQIYDFAGRVMTQSDALGNSTELEFKEDGSTLIHRPDGSTISQIHEGKRKLTRAVDEMGLAAHLEYDEHNRRTSITDRLGDQAGIGWDAESGFEASVTNASGDTMDYVYVEQEQTIFGAPFVFHNLIRVNHPDGSFVDFSYDDHGNLLTRSDAQGNTWTYTYNNKGQVLTEINPLGATTATYTYNEDGTLASMALKNAEPITFEYDEMKRRTRTTHPDGSFMEVKYDLADQIMERRDENGGLHTFSYDQNGNLIAAHDPLGNPTRYHYDALDRVDIIEDKMGQKTLFEYDNMGRRKAIIDPTGFTTRFQFNAHGWLSQIEQGDLSIYKHYDHEGILASQTSPADATTAYESDLQGRITAIINPLNHRTTFNRDAMGRITSIIDPLQRKTEFSFNNRGLLSSATLPDIGSVNYEYNPLGLLSRIVGLNGATWNYDYTPTDQLNSHTDPLGNQWTYSYDQRGRMSQTTYPNNTSLTLSYDGMNNVTEKHFSDGPALSYTFNELNLLKETKDLILEYDLQGRLIQTTSAGIVFGATYDLAGRLVGVGYNGNQMTVTYEYDPATKLLTRVSDNMTGTSLEFGYDDGGQLISISRPNQINTSYGWDSAGRLTEIQEGELIDLQYTLNAAGQVSQLDAVTPAGDPLELLTLEMELNQFDAASQLDGNGYQYDARGRLISSTDHQFTWNGASQLIQLNDIAFEYNGFGALIARTENDVTTQYFYNNAINMTPIVAQRIQGEDTFSRFYVWTPGGSLLYSIDLTSNNAVQYYHFDRNGSTLALTDTAGVVTDAYAYTPYGRLLIHQGETDQPFQYAGRWGVRYENGDLYDMRNRYYDARTARFISREPDWPRTNEAKRINPYAYALNDPINAGDYNGLEPTLTPDGQGGWVGTVSGHHYNRYLEGLGQEVEFVNEIALPLDQLIQQRFEEDAQDGVVDSDEWERTMQQTIQDWRRINPVDESQLSLDELMKWRMAAQSGWSGDEMDEMYRNAVEDWKRWHPRDESQMTINEFIKWRLLGTGTLDAERLRELIQEWQNMHMGERVSVEKWLARYGLIR